MKVLCLIFLLYTVFVWSKECGKYRPRRKRVINGIIAKKNQWPWVVSIFIRRPDKPDSFYYHCGGVLIHDRLVLTAAHCAHRSPGLPRLKPSDFAVFTGEYSVSQKDSGEDLIWVKRYFQHKKWFGNSRIDKSYDIAVMELKTSSNHKAVAHPICLPKRFRYPKRLRCVAVGWGWTDTEGKSGISSFLRHIDIPLMNQVNCVFSWLGKKIDSTMFCGGAIYRSDLDKKNAKGPCIKDSGCPLMCSYDLKTWYVGGIVSWGNVPCLKDKPAVFTNTTYLRSFVTSVARHVGLKLPT